MGKITGITLTLGALLFLAAVFVPVTNQVFSQAGDDAALQVQFISEAHASWQFASLLFALGGAVSAVGLALMAKEISENSKNDSLSKSSYGAAGLAVVGALLWVGVCYYRITLDPAELGGNLNANGWMFPIYTVLTNAALLIMALVMFRTKFPVWLTGIVAIFGLLQLGSYLFTAFSIPAVNYLPILVLGIALLIRPAAVRVSR